jgi:hypothetical protein
MLNVRPYIALRQCYLNFYVNSWSAYDRAVQHASAVTVLSIHRKHEHQLPSSLDLEGCSNPRLGCQNTAISTVLLISAIEAPSG